MGSSHSSAKDNEKEKEEKEINTKEIEVQGTNPSPVNEILTYEATENEKKVEEREAEITINNISKELRSRARVMA